MIVFRLISVTLIFLFPVGFSTLLADSVDLKLSHNKIQEEVSLQNYAQALSLIDEIKKTNSNLYLVNNYDYLSGRLNENIGNTSVAIEIYKSILTRNKNNLLAPWVLNHLAHLSSVQKDFKLEQKYLRQLITDFPNSPAARGMKTKLAESYAADDQLLSAIDVYRSISSQNSELQSDLALALRKAGKNSEARSIFLRLLKTEKNDQALFAAEQLDEMGNESLTEMDHLYRGKLYLSNRHSAGAIRHFRVLIENFPNSKNRANTLYNLGKAYYISDRWDDAIVWYNRAWQEFPSSSYGELGYYQAGHALQNAGHYQEAVSRYELFLKAYPQSEYIGGAHLNAIDALRSYGDFSNALKWCERAEKNFQGQPPASTALFNKAKIFITQSQWQLALGVLNYLQRQSLNTRTPGSTSFPEVIFLKAYCAEQLELYSEAIDLYLQLSEDRNNYYGNCSTERLQALYSKDKAKFILEKKLNAFLLQARNEITSRNYSSAKINAQQALRLANQSELRREILEILKNCYLNIPAYSKIFNYSLQPIGRSIILNSSSLPNQTVADELFFLGLYDEAILEYKSSSPGTKNKILDYSLAVYSNRGNQSYAALDYGESIFPEVPADFRLELLPHDTSELFYPAPYRNLFVKYAKPRNVDPRLLLAIARQESRFKPWAKSNVAARGLFQFVDSTANRIATELKLNTFSRDALYEPETAILFGSQYISDLFKYFPKHAQAVVAAYNAGEIASKRWIERSGSRDIDYFPSEVGYVETKDYVYTVLNNYRIYQQLYDINLQFK